MPAGSRQFDKVQSFLINLRRIFKLETLLHAPCSMLYAFSERALSQIELITRYEDTVKILADVVQ